MGNEVSRFAVGDRVFGYDDTRFGDHAEYLTIGQDAAVATMPDGRDFEVMAPATEGSHYALAYIRAAGVDDGSEVLVYGATGAVGSAAVQLISSLGAHVTAVCSREHVELVAGFGADRVIDRTTTDFTADNRRYDLVFDAVGKCSFRQCRKLLKPRGIWTSTDLGPLSQNPLLVLATRFSRRRRVLFPFRRIDQEMLEYLEGLVESGQFTPVIDRTTPSNRSSTLTGTSRPSRRSATSLSPSPLAVAADRPARRRPRGRHSVANQGAHGAVDLVGSRPSRR